MVRAVKDAWEGIVSSQVASIHIPTILIAIMIEDSFESHGEILVDKQDMPSKSAPFIEEMVSMGWVKEHAEDKDYWVIGRVTPLKTELFCTQKESKKLDKDGLKELAPIGWQLVNEMFSHYNSEMHAMRRVKASDDAAIFIKKLRDDITSGKDITGSRWLSFMDLCDAMATSRPSFLSRFNAAENAKAKRMKEVYGESHDLFNVIPYFVFEWAEKNNINSPNAGAMIGFRGGILRDLAKRSGKTPKVGNGKSRHELA